jgi:hypothetical protein
MICRFDSIFGYGYSDTRDGAGGETFGCRLLGKIYLVLAGMIHTERMGAKPFRGSTYGASNGLLGGWIDKMMLGALAGYLIIPDDNTAEFYRSTYE